MPVGGDVITAIDGQPVKNFDDIVAYLARSTNVNQTVTLTILRDGKEQTVKVTLSARPSSST
jgi:S1-C subfamily serine protease